MWRRSLRRPGFAGLPALIHSSRDWPPRHARVVKPRISTRTEQRSSVRPRMSPHTAAMVIERPRMDPELSISIVTTVSRNSVCFSCLNASGFIGSMMACGSLEVSRIPSSRSNSQDRFCLASRRRCRRLASFDVACCSDTSC